MTVDEQRGRRYTGPFKQQLRESAEAAQTITPSDPWMPILRTLEGRVGHDGIERIATAEVFDALEVPPVRRPDKAVRLSRLMRELGWSNIRARGLNPGTGLSRVRGFARRLAEMV